MRRLARIAGLTALTAAATATALGDNRAPVCTGVRSAQADVYAGDTVALEANATNPDGDPMRFEWAASGGRVVGSGSTVVLDTTGLAAGEYRVTAVANDGKGHFVECGATVVVAPRPDGLADVALASDKTSVMQGETITFTATPSSPAGDGPAVMYEWRASAGSLTRVTDNEVQLDTTGLADSVVVSLWASDTSGTYLTAKSVSVAIAAPPRDGGLIKIEDLHFARDGAKIDRAARRILDDWAIRLLQDATLGLVVDGNADAGERPGIALRRAEAARTYLVERKGVAWSRIVVRDFGDRCSKGSPERNRRVELYPLPQGRAADEIQTCQ